MGRKALWQCVLCTGSALLGSALIVTPGHGAPFDPVTLFVTLNPHGGAQAALQFPFPPPRSLPLAPSLSQALGGPLQQAEWETGEGTWTLFGHCDTAFRRRLLIVQGQIDPEPLLRRLRPLGVHWLAVNVTHPQTGFTICVGARRFAADHDSLVHYFAPLPVASGASALRLTFGYRRGDWLPRAAVLALLLLLPIGLTLLMGRAALRASNTDPAAAWFRYARCLQYVGLAAIPVWAGAVLGLHAGELASFALGWAPDEAGATATFAFMVLPPLLALVPCSFLSRPVYARVRGIEWTRSELAERSLWPLMVGIAPMLLIMAGLDAALHGQPRALVLYLTVALMVRAFSFRAWTKSLGTSPSAVTVGELRDRIFSLAGTAGVRVQQIYVLHAGKGRLANAFAMRGNNVLITDYLLQHLSKREVDAIMAHELAHLKRRDPGKLRAALMLFIAVSIGLYIGLSSLTDLNLSGWLLPVLVALPIMAFYFFSRRREGGADAGAVALTGDAEALITGLAKVSSLNLMPMHWGKWEERFLTHPSTLRRVQTIAAQSGVSPERLQELLTSPLPEGKPYALPPALAGEEQLYSTLFKNQVLTSASWALTAATVLTPALITYLAVQAKPEGLTRAAAALGGLVATLSLPLLAGRTAALPSYRGLRRRLRDRAASEGVRPEEGHFVGFAPSPTPRAYEGVSEWDLGFLWIGSDRLCYLGEQTRFALRRDQVRAARLGPSGPGWWRAPAIYLTWRDEQRGTGDTFHLHLAPTRSPRQLGREARSLARKIQTWRDQPSAFEALPSPLLEWEPPALGEITSAPPRAVFNARAFAQSLFVTTLLAVGASVLFGLPFSPGHGGAGWYVIAVAAAAGVFQWWPYLTYREPGLKTTATRPIPRALER